MLSFEDYLSAVKSLPFGKKVGKNLYILWPDLCNESPLLTQLLEPIGQPNETTLIKFFFDQFKVSFLNYPDFFSDPHPSLKKSYTIDLSTGKNRTIDYSKQENPPILHRKETMISPSRSEYSEWLELTKKLEEYDCYAQSKKIGFKKFWDELLAEKGLVYQGHTLIEGFSAPKKEVKQKEIIDRHKTAMSRSDFSRPLQLLLKHNLLCKNQSFLDYGCGLGDDVRALDYNGYQAIGWDPVYAPKTPLIKSDVVNLGFVLNVIEDPSERIEAIQKAFSLTNKILCIAVVTDTAPTAKDIRPYRDGFLTSRGTFQKYFKHEEVQDLIEEVLNHSAHAVSPGIFFLFPNEQDAQDFLSTRQRRKVNWNQLNLHIYPSKDARDAVKKDLLYQQFKESLEAYWEQLLFLGREPSDKEYPEGRDLKDNIKLNGRRLQEWFIERYGQESLQQAYINRREDLIVYLGLANFKKKVPFTQLSINLQKDMKTFFGSYKAGQQESLTELFKIGDSREIEERCVVINQDKRIGTLDDQALYLKRDELDSLDPVLRMYVGVAGLLYGDINEVDEIKIHKLSGKVTFFIHDSPDLKPGEFWRIKIELSSQRVWYFKHQNE